MASSADAEVVFWHLSEVFEPVAEMLSERAENLRFETPVIFDEVDVGGLVVAVTGRTDSWLAEEDVFMLGTDWLTAVDGGSAVDSSEGGGGGYGLLVGLDVVARPLAGMLTRSQMFAEMVEMHEHLELCEA